MGTAETAPDKRRPKKLPDKRSIKSVRAVVECHGIAVSARQRRCRKSSVEPGRVRPFRVNGIRARCQLLAGRECGEGSAAVCAHGDFEPVGHTVKNAA